MQAEGEGDSERRLLHGLALEGTGSGTGLLGDFDAWCAARECAHAALEWCARDARPESEQDEA